MNLSDILNHGPGGEHQKPRVVLSDERPSNPTYPPAIQRNYPQQHPEQRYHESFIPRTQTIPIHTHPSGRPTTVPHSSVPSSASSSSSSSPSASSNMSLTQTTTPIEDIQGPPRCSYCDDCTTRSPLRKVVSHVFGRNKAETRAIPQTVWVYYCRKHYQRSRYRNPNGFAVLQCELVRRQIDRLITWGGVENWSVKVRKGGKDNQNGRNGATGVGSFAGGDIEMEDDMADLDDMASMNMSMDSSNNTSNSSSPQPPNLVQAPQDPSSTTWLSKFEGHGKTMKEIKHLVDEIEKSLEIMGGTFPDVELLPHCYATPSHEDEENGWMKESHRRKSGPRGGSGRKVRNKGGALSAIQTTRLGPSGASGSVGPGPGVVRRRMTTGDVPHHSPSTLLDSSHHIYQHQQYHHHSSHHHRHGNETISASTSPEATEFDEGIFSDQSFTPPACRTNTYYTHTAERPSFRGGYHSQSYTHYRDEDDARTPTPTALYHQPHHPHHNQPIPQHHHRQQHHPFQDVGRQDAGIRDELVITPPGSVPATSRRTSLENKMLQDQAAYHTVAYAGVGNGLPPSPKSLRRYDETGRWVE